MKVVPLVLMSFTMFALLAFSLFAFVPASAITIAPSHTAKVFSVNCPATVTQGSTFTCKAMINRPATAITFIEVSPTGHRSHVSGTFYTVGCPAGDVCARATFTASEIGTYTIKAEFDSAAHHHDEGIARTKVVSIATPEFPTGAILGVLAPVAALFGYVKFGRRRQQISI